MKKGLMILMLAIFVVYYMGPIDSYNYQGGLDFDDSSYLADSVETRKSVFTTPDNVYRTSGWVSSAGIGRTCHYSIRVIDPVVASQRDFEPLRERAFPRTVIRQRHNFC